MPVEKSQKIKGETKTFEQLIENFKPIPELSGILIFDRRNHDFTPIEAFRNPSPVRSARLKDEEWEAILEIFGF